MHWSGRTVGKGVLSDENIPGLLESAYGNCCPLEAIQSTAASNRSTRRSSGPDLATYVALYELLAPDSRWLLLEINKEAGTAAAVNAANNGLLRGLCMLVVFTRCSTNCYSDILFNCLFFVKGNLNRTDLKSPQHNKENCSTRFYTKGIDILFLQMHASKRATTSP